MYKSYFLSISLIAFVTRTFCFDLNTNADWQHFELIPKSELCALCHSVIGHFQESRRDNPAEFKAVSMLLQFLDFLENDFKFIFWKLFFLKVV